MFGLGTFGVLWMLTPGLPVLRAPRASAEARAAGLELFAHEWLPHDPLARGDGLGPVFNARSCVECHFQGVPAGAATTSTTSWPSRRFRPRTGPR